MNEVPVEKKKELACVHNVHMYVYGTARVKVHHYERAIQENRDSIFLIIIELCSYDMMIP